jgi:hypothetical protein
LQSPSQDKDEVKQQKRHDRALRRARLQIGDEFRPYDLFEEFAILPDGIMALEGLGPGPKLLWGLISKHLGNEGRAFPNTTTLGRELGTNKWQIVRWIKELEDRLLVCTISQGRAADQRDEGMKAGPAGVNLHLRALSRAVVSTSSHVNTSREIEFAS